MSAPRAFRPLILLASLGALTGCAGLGIGFGPIASGQPPAVRTPDRVQPGPLEALLASYVGSRFGRGLNDVDRRRAAEAQIAALEFGRPGQPTPWRNPDSGNAGEVIPGPVRTVGANARCRDFTHNVTVAGRPDQGRGTACRLPDGVWQVAP